MHIRYLHHLLSMASSILSLTYPRHLLWLPQVVEETLLGLKGTNAPTTVIAQKQR